MGSFDAPFRSLRPAADRAQPGDTIYLRGGIYDDHDSGGTAYYGVRISGTMDAPITVTSYPGERAIIDGHQHPQHPRRLDDGYGASSATLFRFIGEHTVWEGITFRNSVGRGFYIVGNDNVFRDIVSHDNHSDGIYLQGSRNLLERIDSFNNYSISNGGMSADGLKMVDGGPILLSNFGEDAETRANVVRYARFWNNSDDGIDIWSSLDTLIEYTMAWSNGYGPTGHGMGFKLGNGGRNNGTVVRYSIGYDNSHNFTTNGSTGVTFLNNTSWRPNNIGFDLRARSAPEDGSEGTNYAYNNISYDASTPASVSAPTNPGPTPIHTHNTWNLDITDPRFVSLDPESPHFLTLDTASPAINAGIDVGLPYDGTAPDLGALDHALWRTPPGE